MSLTPVTPAGRATTALADGAAPSAPDDLSSLLIESPLDLAIFAKAFSERQGPGDALMVMVGPDHHFVDLLPVIGGDDYLDLMVALAATRDDVAGAVLLTWATDDPPQPGGPYERRWERLQTIADHGLLLDWLVVANRRWVWSVAEHARTPAGWPPRPSA